MYVSYLYVLTGCNACLAGFTGGVSPEAKRTGQRPMGHDKKQWRRAMSSCPVLMGLFLSGLQQHNDLGALGESFLLIHRDNLSFFHYPQTKPEFPNVLVYHAALYYRNIVIRLTDKGS